MKKLVIAFLIGIEALAVVAAMDPLDMRWTLEKDTAMHQKFNFLNIFKKKGA